MTGLKICFGEFGSSAPGSNQRRLLVKLAAGLSMIAIVAGSALSARADEVFPGTRRVALVVPFPPGGGVDTVARGIADRMSRELKVPIIVENKPGGSTVVAATYVRQAAPDGHTLLVGTPALSINPALLPDRPPGDPRKVFAPVGRLADLPYVLTVAPNVPVKTVPELIAWSKKEHQSRVMLGNSGPMTAPRMAAELFGQQAGLQVMSVPFRGGAPLTIDLTAGRITGAFAQVSESLAMLDSGAKAIAVSSLKRSSVLPDVPSVAEYFPGFNVTSWNGIYAPLGTPPAVIKRLNEVLNIAVGDEDLQARYAKLGYELVGGSPEDLARHLDSEIKKWSALRPLINLTAN